MCKSLADWTSGLRDLYYLNAYQSGGRSYTTLLSCGDWIGEQRQESLPPTACRSGFETSLLSRGFWLPPWFETLCDRMSFKENRSGHSSSCSPAERLQNLQCDCLDQRPAKVAARAGVREKTAHAAGTSTAHFCNASTPVLRATAVLWLSFGALPPHCSDRTRHRAK